jgi:alpha-glucosidase
LVTFRLARDANRSLTYSVSLGAAVAVEPSRLGIVVDGKDLGDDVEIGRAETYVVDETYPWYGVHATAVNRCRGSRVTLTSRGASSALDIRACDDGAAFRYVVPGEASATRTPDEATRFRFPAGSSVWTHDFEGHYEGMHAKRGVADVRAGEWVATPLTIKLPGGAGYVSITESALVGYSGMTLRADGRSGFAARLAHEAPISYPFFLRYFPDDIARLSKPATIAGTITSPWRVVIAGRTLNAMVNADIVHNLAPPPDPALFPEGVKTSWVRPGRAMWRFLDGGDNTFDGVKAFTRLGQQLGFEYHVVEGLWQRWTDEQMRDFMADARARHVGIWLWKDSRALSTVEEQRAFFDKCQALGVVGAKIDFFDHESKAMIDRYQSILRESAARHVMVNFHGANKPAKRNLSHELTPKASTGSSIEVRLRGHSTTRRCRSRDIWPAPAIIRR